MREIKFRVWDNIDYLTKPFTLDDVVMGKVQFTTKDSTVMQFTGLHDKKGKEIYEGDIVKSGDKIEQVVFKYGEFTARNHYSYGEYSGGVKMAGGSIELLQVDNREVIGNIYSNPELIK